MKNFVLKFLLYVSMLVFILFCAMAVTVPQYEQEYTGAVVDKVRRLESIQEPKIILVGNSCLAFGMDSAQIEAAFGMPVVNLGIHAGLGDEFHYNMAKKNISEGDIVILTNTHYHNYPLNDIHLAWITIEDHEGLWELISAENRLSMLAALPRYIIKRATLSLKEPVAATGAYSRAAFNEYGDVAYPREINGVSFGEIEQTVPEITEEGIALINEMNAFCEERGAVCLLAGYPIAYGEFSPPAEEFCDMVQTLESRVDCEIISDCRDYFFDYAYFYDTQYHLTNTGADLRTKQLIADLQNWQKTQSHP